MRKDSSEWVTPGSSTSELEPSLIPSTVLSHVTGEDLRALALGERQRALMSSGDRGPEFELLLHYFPVVGPPNESLSICSNP